VRTIIIPYDEDLYVSLKKMAKTLKRKADVRVKVTKRRGEIIVEGENRGISAVFTYYAYLKARRKGRSSILYLEIPLGDNDIPKEVREIAERWLYSKITFNDVKNSEKIDVERYYIGSIYSRAYEFCSKLCS
jgi:hypothetical protein